MIVAFFRELFGFGQVFGITVFKTVQDGGWYPTNGLMVTAPAAFFLIGALIGSSKRSTRICKTQNDAKRVMR